MKLTYSDVGLDREYVNHQASEKNGYFPILKAGSI